MMKQWSFYEQDTGLISSRRFGGNERHLERNTPAGYLPIEGQYDRLSQRVDTKTVEVVDYQPPSPGDDYEWNATSKRWVLRAEIVEQQRKHDAAMARIEEAEAEQARPIRELLLNPDDAAALQKLTEINDEITTLRSDLILE